MSDLANLEERRLTITPLQDSLLRQAEARVASAQEYFSAVASAILAGHDIEAARILRIEPDHTLVIEVIENGKKEPDAAPG
jgi:hypothetical protein